MEDASCILVTGLQIAVAVVSAAAAAVVAVVRAGSSKSRFPKCEVSEIETPRRLGPSRNLLQRRTSCCRS